MNRIKPIHLALIAVSIALFATILGVVGNAVRSQQDCRKIETNKSILYATVRDNVARIRSGDLDEAYLRVYGDDLVNYEGKLVPRWTKERNKALVDNERLVNKLAPSECVLIFIP